MFPLKMGCFAGSTDVRPQFQYFARQRDSHLFTRRICSPVAIPCIHTHHEGLFRRPRCTICAQGTDAAWTVRKITCVEQAYGSHSRVKMHGLCLVGDNKVIIPVLNARIHGRICLWRPALKTENGTNILLALGNCHIVPCKH
jgi:hypothetical protein